MSPHLARFAEEAWRLAGTWSSSDQEAFHGYHTGWQAPNDPSCPFRDALRESLHQLAKRWRAPELGALAAELLFCAEWRRRPAEAFWLQPHVSHQIIQACLIQCPPPDILRRLEGELRLLFAHPFDHPLISPEWLGGTYPPLEPLLWDALGLLVALPPSPAGTTLALRILHGEFDGGSFDPEPPEQQGRLGPRPAYRIYVQPLRGYAPHLLQIAYEASRLDLALFAGLAGRLPFLDEASVRVRPDGAPGRFHTVISPACSELILGYCEQLAWECTQDLTEENAHLLCSIGDLQGNRWLLQALRLYASGLVGKPTGKGFRPRDTRGVAIIHLAKAAGVEPETAEERQALLVEVRALPAPVLKDLLPYAWYAQTLLCEALGWQAQYPLVEEIMRLTRLRETPFSYEASWRNSADPAGGVVDVPRVRSVLAQVGEGAVRELLSLFGSDSTGGALLLLRACCGWDRPRVEESLLKRQQLAVKAYGLLPLSGPDEVLERYLFFRQYARESARYGPQRQAHERAAAQAALANLAQVAGYADPVRLEWAMEGRLAEQLPQPALSAEVGDYVLQISLESGAPKLAVSRQGRPLKSVPSAVRRDAAYSSIKETLEQLRGQVARFRSTFEEMMATGEALSRADLAGLACLPVARAMLSRLALRSDEGVLGLFEPEGPALRGLDGALHALGEAALIAHPYHLLAARELAGWQRHVVTKRIVQPFKQAFRELYLLTPAEREAGAGSERFAGHTVNGAVAARLLQARGWALEKGFDDRTLPCRFFAAAGLWACFEFPRAGFYLGMEDAATGRIVFRPRHWRPSRWWLDRETVPLMEVPPTLFSEVMRDADLVVSVANRDTGAQLSAEVYERRGQLLSALIDDLGLHRVTVGGHYARVEGRLARYRVHLASGAIHIEPGNYLCVVPAPAQPDERIFLPFADAGEPQLAEIISKVLLLLNDDRIRDASILNQIRAAGGP